VSERTILCFGDSNTHGTIALPSLGERRRHPRDVRWPGRLEAALGAGWRVIEEGHPGRTTLHDDPVEGAHKNGLTVLPALLETHRPIDLVVIMLGTNDLKARYALTPMDIALSVEKLALVVRASPAGPEGAAPRLLIVSPVPILESGCLAEIFAGGAQKSQALAPRLRDVAERLGCPFVDAGRAASVDPLDGVHLGPEAHATIADAILDGVRAALA
jgi:lysophospholipase L1-like esterase